MNVISCIHTVIAEGNHIIHTIAYYPTRASLERLRFSMKALRKQNIESSRIQDGSFSNCILYFDEKNRRSTKVFHRIVFNFYNNRRMRRSKNIGHACQAQDILAYIIKLNLLYE